jgi:glycosyltransferase involved in cell wall biosynthesis
LRLAVVSPFVDRSHGTERALAELLDRLARRYHCEIHLYSQRVADIEVQTPGAALGEETGSIFWHKVPSIAGPQLVRFIWWLVANGLIRRFDALVGRKAVDLVLSPGINCLNADVVIVHALFHRLYQLSGATNSEGIQRVGFFRALHRRAYYLLLTLLERHVYRRRSVSLAAVSQRTANLLAQYFRRDAVLIPNGVDNLQFSVTARLSRRTEARRLCDFRDTDFVLLLIGNDWRVKGVPAVLAAMAAAPALPLCLLAVGSEPVGPIQEMANSLGVAQRCIWVPPQRDVMEFYGAADAYVSPTCEDSFGLPVAEAMACGLPVITSAMAGVSAQIRNNTDGFVLNDPNDVRLLSQILERLYSDEALRVRIGEAAAVTAKAWSWDRSAEALWSLLRSAAKEK